MKAHIFRELVNGLRDIATQWYGSQQLRERISRRLHQDVSINEDPANDNPWKATVIDQLVIAHILTAEHESDPLKAIQDLQAYHAHIAVDPRISGAAAKLVEQARAEEREACALVCESRESPGTGSVAILRGAAAAIRAMSMQELGDLLHRDCDQMGIENHQLRKKLAELEGQTDNLLSTCHRLALELECLLLDTKDLAPVSRWWDSAMVALDEWHKAKDSVSARPVPAEPVNTRLQATLECLTKE